MSRKTLTDTFLTQTMPSITPSGTLDLVDGHTLLGGALEDLYSHIIAGGAHELVGDLQAVRRLFAEAAPASLTADDSRPVISLDAVIKLTAQVSALEVWYQTALSHLGTIQASVGMLAGGLLPMEEKPCESGSRPATGANAKPPPADLPTQAIDALGGGIDDDCNNAGVSDARSPSRPATAASTTTATTGYLGDTLGSLGSYLELIDHDTNALEEATWLRATGGATLALQVETLRGRVKAGETPTTEEVVELLTMLVTVTTAANRLHASSDCIAGYSKQLLPELADLPRWHKASKNEGAA